jgi:hypothetical protein
MTQQISVLVHDAHILEDQPDYLKSPGKLFFVVVTNFGDRAIELTHVWVEGHPKVHVLDGLPKRLEPDGQWISYVAAELLSHVEDPYTALRAYTSRQSVFHSSRNDTIPAKGN